MGRLFFIVLKLLLTLILLGAATWGAGFLLFRLPGTIATIAAICFGIAALAGLLGIWTSDARLTLGFATVFVGLLGWWSSFQPSHDRDWIPELAKLPSIARQGDAITVSNLRHFHWRTEEDYDQVWETRRYNLAAVTGADAFLTYWSGEAIAHLMISFTFSDSVPLTISI